MYVILISDVRQRSYLREAYLIRRLGVLKERTIEICDVS